MRIDNKPAQLFPREKAESVAAELQASDDDGWTYRAIHDPTGRGLSYILIADENGETVGKF